MQPMEFLKNTSLRFFLIVITYYVGLVIFMTGLLPMDDITYKDKVSFQVDSGPATRFVLMIVDGLRSDMLLSPQYAQYWSKLGVHLKERASVRSVSSIQPPTVTMPRIKAITSGRVPKFVDVLRNLDTTEMHGDTWLSRLVDKKKWALEFYGDDTWIKLFPGLFRKIDGTNSFFVNDYHEVDLNVTRHLKNLFHRPRQWNGVILHYLGLDHIGHVEGPKGASIQSKLKEMDDVVDYIVTQLNKAAPVQNESWVFVLTGDHGMSDQGGHGGSTFGEVHTGLVLISSKPRTDPSVTVMKSQQVDLATFMGLVTGAGIPKSSLGLIPLEWLDSFWPDPISRIQTFARVLRHYALLSGCVARSPETEWDELPTMDPSCSSNFIKQDEIILYNTLAKHLELKYIYMHKDKVSIGADRSSALKTDSSSFGNNGSHEFQMYRLLGDIQLRALSGAHQLDDFSMVTGALLMWIVTLFVWQKIVVQLISPVSHSDVAYSRRYDSAQAKSIELFSLQSAKLVSTVSAVLLVLQTISLGGSSFAEEEHQFWYYFGTSLMLLTACMIGLGCPTWTLKRSGFRDLFAVMILDRVLLRRLHQTGSKWIHLPDLSDWLHLPEHSIWLWFSQIGAWCTLVLYRIVAINRHSGNRQLCQSCLSPPVLSMVLVAFGQLGYRWAVASSEHEWTIFAARLVYLLLAVDCFALWFWRRNNRTGTGLQLSTASTGPDWSQTNFDALHPVSTFPLLICLLGRPSVSLLWIGVIWKEFWLASVMELLWDRFKWSRAQPSRWHLGCCWLLYWIHGWATYFEQGNSISLATVDVSAAYVGLRTHQPVIAGMLLACYTYAGPLYWQLAYFARYTLQLSNSRLGTSLALFRLGFVILPLTFCATVCFLLQSHLFIWTVFTPKLLYLATFQLVFIPVLLLWGCKSV